MRTDDRELVLRTLAGERCAFAALVERYRDMVYGVAYHYLGHPEDAQDTAQEAFVQAYGRLRQLREADKFAAWLRRLTLNLCADHLRRSAQWLTGADVPGTASASEPRESLTTRLIVQEALGRLSDKTRLTVTLCYMGGYSHAEIARFLEIPLNTVRSRLQHAKRQLREEMMTMVNDMVNADKPGEAWTRQVVEEAMRRGAEALKAYQKGQAVHYYDEALSALDSMEPGADEMRLRMDALWQRGTAFDPSLNGVQAAIPFFERSLALAEELGDRADQADKLFWLGQTLANSNNQEYVPRVNECWRKALAIYRELGDARGQGRCLMNLGFGRIWDNTADGKRLYEEALARYEEAQDRTGIAQCRAMLEVIAEVGEDRFPQGIIGFFAGCDCMEEHPGTLAHRFESSIISYTWDESFPRPLRLFRVFWQSSHLHKFLDANVPVGGSWSGNAFSYSQQPLHATVTVLSAGEYVAVPAGEFDNCLITEQITVESDLPDEGAEEAKESNRRELCGACRAWYAPGVGLVQLHVVHLDGSEATIQLHDYHVQSGRTEYLPLEIGNSWTYGWADVPAEYVAKEAYRVTGHKEDLWYLEHCAYAYKQLVSEEHSREVV